MRIEKIEISNYKSVSNPQHLSLQNKVTALIGKNESGKSNVLDCIGNLDINSSNETTRRLISHPSRDKLKDSSEVILTFRIDEEVKSNLNVQYQNTKIQFSTNDTPFMGRIIQGFGKEYFENSEFLRSLEKLKEILNAHFTVQHNLHKQIFYTALSALEDLTEIHNLKWKNQINFLFSLEKQIFNEEDSILFIQQLKFVQSYANFYYDEFPEIVYYTEQNLKSQYSFKKEDFENLLTSHGEMLVNFIQAAKFDKGSFEEMMLTTNSGRKQDLIDDLRELINTHINMQFNKFYPQEKVSLVATVDNNTLKFFVKSRSGNINISERSNGLKWYLNLFITIVSKNIQNKNIFFVIDEPGVHLHVDAQKELRRLFYDLPTNYQILYSTHSPFMINESHISDIKVIQKNEKGITEIVNSVFSEKIIQSSKKETLSPILKSIGMSQEHVFSVNRGKINVITEGITDAIYLRAMATCLDENRFVFIPAVGASNIHNLGLILWGWGMNYICLYDFDSAGIREQNKASEKYGLGNTINLSKVCEGSSVTIENLIDDKDFEIVGLKKELVKKSESKMIDATNLSSILKDEEIAISEKTKSNFTLLFNLMGDFF